MADIFVEVDEALKQERLEKLWKQYGGFFIGCLIALVAGTAMFAGYETWQTSKNTKQTNLYLETVSTGDYTPDDLLTIAPQLSDSLRGIAELQAAGLALENNDMETALSIYEQAANDQTLDTALRQLASYMHVTLSSDISADETLSQLETIYTDTQNPWRHHARLEAALTEAYDKKNFTQARTHLAAILNADSVPQTLQQKAQSLDILYALKEKI